MIFRRQKKSFYGKKKNNCDDCNAERGKKTRTCDKNTNTGTNLGLKWGSNGKNSIFADSFLDIMIHKNIPEYYVTRDNIIFFLIFVFVYSLLFVNIFTPFQGAWYNIQHYTRAQLFTDTLIIITGGTIVLLISRIIMYYTHKKKALSYLQYWFWQVLEIFCIAFLYSLIVHFVTKDTREFSEIFARAVIFVPTILIIPVIITLLYFSTREKDEKISALESQKAESNTLNNKNEHTENQIVDSSIKEDDFSFSDDFTEDDMILDNHLTGTERSAQSQSAASVAPERLENVTEPPVTSKIVNFFDEKQELQLSLRLDHIYYIESAENYVHIYYRNKESVERFTLRSSLKKQQEKLEKHGFIRCHRSYLVNFANILLLRKDKDGPYLDFGQAGLQQIPISKTYLDAVTAYFIQNSDE